MGVIKQSLPDPKVGHAGNQLGIVLATFPKALMLFSQGELYLAKAQRTQERLRLVVQAVEHLTQIMADPAVTPYHAKLQEVHQAVAEYGQCFQVADEGVLLEFTPTLDEDNVCKPMLDWMVRVLQAWETLLGGILGAGATPIGSRDWLKDSTQDAGKLVECTVRITDMPQVCRKVSSPIFEDLSLCHKILKFLSSVSDALEGNSLMDDDSGLAA